jgi:hypothetical protein
VIPSPIAYSGIMPKKIYKAQSARGYTLSFCPRVLPSCNPQKGCGL